MELTKEQKNIENILKSLTEQTVKDAFLNEVKKWAHSNIPLYSTQSWFKNQYRREISYVKDELAAGQRVFDGLIKTIAVELDGEGLNFNLGNKTECFVTVMKWLKVNSELEFKFIDGKQSITLCLLISKEPFQMKPVLKYKTDVEIFKVKTGVNYE